MPAYLHHCTNYRCLLGIGRFVRPVWATIEAGTTRISTGVSLANGFMVEASDFLPCFDRVAHDQCTNHRHGCSWALLIGGHITGAGMNPARSFACTVQPLLGIPLGLLAGTAIRGTARCPELSCGQALRHAVGVPRRYRFDTRR